MKAKYLLFTLGLLLALASCSKYEKGPNLSFRTKKERLTNKWYAHELISPDGVVSLEQTGDYLIFHKDKNCEMGSTINYFKDSGSWKFVQNKEYIEVNLVRSYGFEYQVYSYLYKIIKLKNNKLILENEQGQQIEYRSFN